MSLAGGRARREWWLADWLPSAMLGVGSALASAFGPTIISDRPWQVGLFVAGGVLLVSRPFFLTWRSRRKAGSAVLVYAALPDFTPGWETRARNYTAGRYLEVLPHRRTLPADAGEWKVPARDVTNHVQYLFESPDDWGFDSRDPSLFISAPWPVGWAMAAASSTMRHGACTRSTPTARGS